MSNTYNIAVIPGDGTGPEVVAEGVKTLQAISKLFAIDFQFTTFDLGGERYLKKGILVTDEEINRLKAMDAIFLGAIGHPDVEPGLVERSVILGLRFGLDMYVNLRPIKLYSEQLCPLKKISFLNSLPPHSTEPLY